MEYFSGTNTAYVIVNRYFSPKIGEGGTPDYKNIGNVTTNASKTGKEKRMQQITPFLWFNNNAEEAVNFYLSIFNDSKLLGESRYGEAGPGPKGSVMTMKFQLNGLEFVALNGGPVYSFNPAVSFVVNCENQAEVDHHWDKLVEGGKPVQCGWLVDKYGLSWQIVPTALPKLLTDPDPARAKRVMEAMLKMVKLNIAELENAANAT
jgi:predicted 3-demethylubiquinone-9 3-methyltransferase (glyoxalase superfamily)